MQQWFKTVASHSRTKQYKEHKRWHLELEAFLLLVQRSSHYIVWQTLACLFFSKSFMKQIEKFVQNLVNLYLIISITISDMPVPGAGYCIY